MTAAKPKLKGLRAKKVQMPTVLWKRKFLDQLLRSEGNVTAAALAVGIHKMDAYMARRSDPDFEAEWAEAIAVVRERRADEIERTMAEGAIDGHTSERVTNQGQVVQVREAPDTSAGAFLLKGYRPVMFREKPPAAGMGEFGTLAELFKAVAEARAAALPPAPPRELPPASGALIEVTAEPEKA